MPVEKIIGSLGPMVVSWSRGEGQATGYTLRKRQPSLAHWWSRWLRIGRRFSCDDDVQPPEMAKPVAA